MKKTFAFLLSLTMILSLFGLTTFAAPKEGDMRDDQFLIYFNSYLRPEGEFTIQDIPEIDVKSLRLLKDGGNYRESVYIAELTHPGKENLWKAMKDVQNGNVFVQRAEVLYYTDKETVYHDDTDHQPCITPGQRCTDDIVCQICGVRIPQCQLADSYLGIHNVERSSCTDYGRCRDCGGLIFGHSAAQAPCTEPTACVYCGEEVDPKEGYTYYHKNISEIEVGETLTDDEGNEYTKFRTAIYCPDCGLKIPLVEPDSPIIKECQHEWQDATCIAPKTCRICGAMEGEKDPDQHMVALIPEGTCQDDICSKCGAIMRKGTPDEREAHWFDHTGTCHHCGKTEFELFGNHICSVFDGAGNCIICHREGTLQSVEEEIAYTYCETFGHTPGAEATKTEAQTCTVCGVVLKEATGKGNPHTAAGDLFGATAMLSLAAAAAVLLKKKR